MNRADDDPFDGIGFDESFVEAAPVREADIEAMAARRTRERALQDRLETQPDAVPSHRGRVRTWIRHPWRSTPVNVKAGVVIGIVVMVLLVANTGLLGDASTPWQSGDPVVATTSPTNRPTPVEARSDVPLGEPEPVPPGGGAHEFSLTQTGTAVPVSWDPCRPVPVVVNLRGGPNGALSLVQDALAEMSLVTGLDLVLEGTSDEPASVDRAIYQPDRYGDRWAPALVAWSNPDEIPELEGVVAGVAVALAVDVEAGGPLTYVSGSVALDSPDIERMLGHQGGYEEAESVVLHEIGHLVGLGHTDDPGQLMHDEGNPDIVEPQAGDREGLARLGRGPCFDQL